MSDSTDARSRQMLKEADVNAFPWRIKLPDGEEHRTYKNFRLRTPEDERAMTDTSIIAPPNVTVDHLVCENMYWNEGHRCQGDLSLPTCPPSYGSQTDPWRVGEGFCSATSCSSSSSSHENAPSKNGKFKEVLSSFVRSVLPSSRSSCRSNKHDQLDADARRKEEKEALASGRSKPDVKNRGTCPVMVNSRSVGVRNPGLSANSFPGPPRSQLGGKTTGETGLFGGRNLQRNCTGSSHNPVHSAEPPPTYEKAMRDKMKEEKGKQ